MGEALQTSQNLVIGHDIALIDARGQMLAPSYFERLDTGRLPASLCIKGCLLAFRRELISMWGWPGPRSGASHDLWIASLTLAAGRRGVLNRVLGQHRLHGRLRPDVVASRVARTPGMADSGALARFCRAASFHRFCLRYLSGARNRHV
jgi:hypothetical protein